MKDDDILLPEKKLEVRGYHHREMERIMIDYAREAVRMNTNPDSADYDAPWKLVVETLREVQPGWNRNTTTVGSAATAAAWAIRKLAASEQLLQAEGKPVPEPSRLPFDLEAAKRGEPLVTRDGRKARFVGHFPEFCRDVRLAVCIDGEKSLTELYENGRVGGSENIDDLFLAPKPKRTVWVNVEKYGGQLQAFAYFDKKEAEVRAVSCYHVATAVPIQIDDVGGEG